MFMKGIPSFSFNSCNVFQLGWVGGISLWKTLTGKERHFSGCDVDLSTFIRRSFNLRQRSAPSEFDNWSVLLPFVTFLTHCPVKYNLFTFTFHSTEKVEVGIFFRLQSLLIHKVIGYLPSSMYSWSIVSHILEHGFFCLGRLGSSGQ